MLGKWFRKQAPKLYRGPRAAVEVTYVKVGEAASFLGPGSLVLDARSVDCLEGLRAAHATVQRWVQSLRAVDALRLIVVLRRAEPNDVPEAFACSEALRSYAWSAARELGPKFGATVNILRLNEWCADAGHTLHFLLSGRAACVSRTELDVCRSLDPATPPPTRVLPEEMDDHHSYVAGLRCLVTGATGGIGRAVTTKLQDAGARLALVDGTDADVKWPYKKVNLLTKDAAEEIRDFAYETFQGHVDVACHIAGITKDRTLHKMSDSEWDDCLNVNFAAPLTIDRLLQPTTSVLFSSISGITGNLGQANYSSAKRALAALATASSAPRNIQANHRPNYRVIAPGFVDTAMTRKIPFLTRLIAANFGSTLQQPVLPEDIANATAFLASPHSAGLRGQTLRVCGGFLLG